MQCERCTAEHRDDDAKDAARQVGHIMLWGSARAPLALHDIPVPELK